MLHIFLGRFVVGRSWSLALQFEDDSSDDGRCHGYYRHNDNHQYSSIFGDIATRWLKYTDNHWIKQSTESTDRIWHVSPFLSEMLLQDDFGTWLSYSLKKIVLFVRYITPQVKVLQSDLVPKIHITELL